MTALLGILLLAVAPLLAQQPTPPPSTDSSIWPDPGVARSGAGVTAPRITRETKPNYTGDAIRARIQGIVVLECVVETDGSVGPVRVVRSLDPVYGLDEAAVTTVKQWRFQPGMKEGVPVRVAITVQMSFTLRGGPGAPPDSAPPRLGWPDAFADATDAPGSRVGTWSEDSVQTDAVLVRFAYPTGWSILRSAESNRLVTLHADDVGGNRTVTISQPGPAPFALIKPLPQSALQDFLNNVGRMPGLPANMQSLASGQVERPDGLWIWFEMAAPIIDAPTAPPALAEHLHTAHDGMRVWAFTTTAAGQTISVFCSLLHAAATSDADKKEEIRRAGLEFGGMLRQISIQSR